MFSRFILSSHSFIRFRLSTRDPVKFAIKSFSVFGKKLPRPPPNITYKLMLYQVNNLNFFNRDLNFKDLIYIYKRVIIN